MGMPDSLKITLAQLNQSVGDLPGNAEAMLAARHGQQAMGDWQRRREAVLERAVAYDTECMAGPMQPIYRFGDDIIDESAIEMDAGHVHIPGFAQDIDLRMANRYADMTR